MRIAAGGNVGISTGVPQGRLDVMDDGNTATDMVQIWRASDGVIKGSMSATGVMMADKFIGDGSLLTNLDFAGAGDDLGNHVATKTLDMSGFDIVNVSTVIASSITVQVSDDAQAGIMVKNLSDTANARASVKFDAGNGGSTGWFGALPPNYTLHEGWDDSLVFWADSAASNGLVLGHSGKLIRFNAINGAEDMRIQSGNLGISTRAPAYKLDVTGGGHFTSSMTVDGEFYALGASTFTAGVAMSKGQNVYMPNASNIYLGDGAENQVLSWDGDGSLKWASVSTLGGGDNLGNHVATKTLNMANYDMVGVSTLTVSSITTTKASVTFSTNVIVGGNLGVGVVPNAKFAIGANALYTGEGYVASFYSGSDTAVSILSNGNNNGYGPRLRFFENNPNKYGTELYYDSGYNHFSIINYSNNNEVGRILMTSGGDVGISTGAPAARLDVRDNGSAATDMVQIWRNSGGTIQSSMSATGVMMANKFIGDGSLLTNLDLAGAGDNLGSHVATTTLNMNSFPIVNVSSLAIVGSTGALLSVSGTDPGAGNTNTVDITLADTNVTDTAATDKFALKAYYNKSGTGDQTSYKNGVFQSLGAISDGTLAHMMGYYSALQVKGIGSASNLYNFYASSDTGTGGGTVGARSGLFVKDLGRALTTQYGVYIENLTSGANNYGIYSVGGNNFFGGNVTAGSSMTVTGSITASSGTFRNGLYVTNVSTLTGNMYVNGVSSFTNTVMMNNDKDIYLSTPSRIHVTGGVANQVLTHAGNNSLKWADVSSLGGDNLGNHIATQNLNMSSKDIVAVSTLTVSSITTTAAGVNFSTNVYVSKGNVGIGVVNPTAKLEVGDPGAAAFKVVPAAGYISLFVNGSEVARMKP